MNNEKEKFWQNIEELNPSPQGLDPSQGEFPKDILNACSRRDFLKIMGFSTAAVMASCSPMPTEKSIPYLVQPENILPGKAYWYSSVCGGCSAGCGILAKNREGRPIKIEGNPDTPLNRGGLCALGQAGVLELYDSARLHYPLENGQKTTWKEQDAAIISELKAIRKKGGKIRLLTGTIHSPTLKNIIREFLQKNPQAKHITYDAVSVSAIIEAHQKAFGLKVLPHFRFDRAKIMVGIAADFLGTWISPVEFTKQYAKARTISESHKEMAQHIQFESRLSLTGANADIRSPMKPSDKGLVVLALLDAVLRQLGQKNLGKLPTIANRRLEKSINETAKKLVQNRGKSLIVSSSNTPAIQLALAKLNHVLGNYGKTIDIRRPSLQKQGLDLEMRQLVKEMNGEKISALIISGCNPAYDYADSDQFVQGLKKVKLSVSLNDRLDETTKLVRWAAPDHHYLESWNDAEPFSGLVHLAQPALSPVYQTRHRGETLMRWMGNSASHLNRMKEFWRKGVFPKQKKILSFKRFWQRAVHDGNFHMSKVSGSSPSFKASIAAEVQRIISAQKKYGLAQGFELFLYESIALRDGRAANNPWLQEMPDPISKGTWGNPLNISVSDAKNLGLKSGDIVSLHGADQKLETPVNIQPGQMAGTLSMALGYGRRSGGKVANGVGANSNWLMTWNGNNRRYGQPAIKISKTGRSEKLSLTQTHADLHGRPIIQETTLASLHDGSHVDKKAHSDLVMLWQQHETKGHSWAMAIDQNACTGCSACLISCQAENNVPVVGKKEVERRREMHWIRIDRYYKGNPENPEVAFQPMMCQHCANAPCESVCPVLATVHSSDGLNQQVYNRCVGTRYCANNCPYKVRRFNWFDYANNQKFDFYMNNATGKLVLNPDIVVRSRGVMEKCSMCVQRIQEENNKSRREGRPVDSSRIQTACQQSCPSDAILFGDLKDPKSKLSNLLEKNERHYRVLEELNVKPAVHYLKKVRNIS